MNPLTKKAIDIATERALEEVLGKVAGRVAAAELLILECFEHEVDERMEAARERAQSVLGCPHVFICKPRFSRQGEMCNLVMRLKGCAFIYDGALLWHPTYNIDASKLSARVLRYSPQNHDAGYYHPHPSRCIICHPEDARVSAAALKHVGPPPAIPAHITVQRF